MVEYILAYEIPLGGIYTRNIHVCTPSICTRMSMAALFCDIPESYISCYAIFTHREDILYSNKNESFIKTERKRRRNPSFPNWFIPQLFGFS